MWHTMKFNEVAQKLNTDISSGLSEKEALDRLNTYGANCLKEKKKKSIFLRFLAQFNDFMIIILIIASIISAFVTKVEGTGDYIDSVIIIAIVVFNSILGLIQESKAEKSLEALKKMSAPMAKVKRDGKLITIDSNEVVPGDVIILESGCFVPADARLIQSFNLKVEESSLTGETVPVLKNATSILVENCSIGDTLNMVFASTTVTNGHAEAIVTATGMQTKVGKIAHMIISDETPETPIQKKLAEVGKVLGVTCLSICALIFVIGIFKNISPLEMFMTSVGLAVAAIPEGLPAIVTIMLSIGVTKMAKKNSIIRKLPAVETLGSSSVICSDKTGTLTQNKMTVVKLMNSQGKEASPTEKQMILKLASMCTDVSISDSVTGEPTEVAITCAALSIGENKNNEPSRINEIPFDSSRKLMSTIHRINGKYRVITKGAPDVLMNRCDYYLQNNIETEMTTSMIYQVSSQNNQMAQNSLRVIGVAYCDLPSLPLTISSETIETGLTFLGLIGMIDPPREGVKEAIATCKRAGIKPVMITGDHIVTAKAIASELQILDEKKDLSITGAEIDKMSESDFHKNIMKYSVFARVSPEHKVKIVKAFQSHNKVVAMTGDGVNDAPALKNADIGISMGIGGTDVAKNASDMVLADDNFATIVDAVKEGRNIFSNIQKAIHFLLATNIGEIVTIFLGLLLGMKSPLLAIQLLWINLVTDSLPAIALGLEAPDKNIMNVPPRDAKKSIFSDGLSYKIFFEGLMIGILTLFSFTIGLNFFSLEVARTMAFITLGATELIHSFNIKSHDSIFKVGFLENRYLVLAFVLGIFLQVGVSFVPALANIFKLVPLTGFQFLVVAILSVLPVVIIELQKKFNQMELENSDRNSQNWNRFELQNSK